MPDPHPDGYTVSTDHRRIDRDAVWRILTASYWSPGIDRATVDRAIDSSVCFSLFAPDRTQAGFARVLTDRARLAYVSDVFVGDTHRGRGLGVWLMEAVLAHPDLAPLKVMLATSDAHGLYARFGFRTVDPAPLMERPRPRR